MNFHQSYSFSKIAFKSFSLLAQPLCFSFSRSISTIYGGVSRRHFSDFEDRRRVPLKSLPILPKMHSSSLMTSSHNCFRLWEFFSPIRSISWVVSISFLRRPSCHNSSFSVCSYRSPNLTGASFKYPLISSWSLCSHVSKSPQVSSHLLKFMFYSFHVQLECYQNS